MMVNGQKKRERERERKKRGKTRIEVSEGQRKGGTKKIGTHISGMYCVKSLDDTGTKLTVLRDKARWKREEDTR